MGEIFALSHSDSRDPSSRDLEKMTRRMEQFQGRVFVAAEVGFGRDQVLNAASSLAAT